MPGDDYEPNRVLGVPWTRDRQARQGEEPQARRGEEPQRVMGFPVDWFSGVDLDWVQLFAHPIREYQRWRRRSGPYATDEDELKRSR